MIYELIAVAIVAFLLAWMLNASPYPPFRGWWMVGHVLFCVVMYALARSFL